MVKKVSEKPDQVDQSSIDLIAKFGWSVMAVHPSIDDPEETPNFMYTINLDEHCGLPELIVFGIPQEAAHGILAGIVEKAEKGWRWCPPEQRLTDILNDEVPLELRAVHPSHFSEHMGCSASFRRVTGRIDLKEVVQVIWPNSQGIFPWDWAEENKWHQPVLDKPNNNLGAAK